MFGWNNFVSCPLRKKASMSSRWIEIFGDQKAWVCSPTSLFPLLPGMHIDSISQHLLQLDVVIWLSSSPLNVSRSVIFSCYPFEHKYYHHHILPMNNFLCSATGHQWSGTGFDISVQGNHVICILNLILEWLWKLELLSSLHHIQELPSIAYTKGK
jgi:hypothetical protein